MQLTQKELGLLKDLKNQEQLCIDKYYKHASCAKDPQLQQLFNSIASVEKQHLDTIQKIEAGSVPSTNDSQQMNTQVPTSFQASSVSGEDQKLDTYLCSDVLAGEKHVSSLYDTCIFEFGAPELRKVLNHIQTEEQQHGEAIYQYMKVNNMYA